MMSLGIAFSSRTLVWRILFLEPTYPSFLNMQRVLAWTAENEIFNAEDFGHVPHISIDIYNIIRTKFEDLNGDSSTSQPFKQTEFPSSTVLNAFIQSYFEYFHSGFPMLHKPSFDPGSNKSSWFLILAVATIGCRFSLASSPQIQFLLQESLRRSIIRILLDFQFSALFDLPALIDIDSIHLPMPCSENLWNADTEELWHSNMTQEPSRFGALILTFGIYRDEIDSEAKYNYLSMVRPDEAHMQSKESLEQLIFQHNHTLSLFTKLPPRRLFAFSGWRTTVAQQKKAEKHIRDWLSEDMVGSRLCLVHAAKVYSSVRSTRTYGHHEAMAILLSTIAIWSISSIHRVVSSSSSAESVPNNHAACAQDSAEGLAKKRTIRLDKTLDGSLLAAWISGQVDFRPYLAGIGTLDDQGTVRRLIRDSLQQLMYSVTWCLGQAVAEVLKTHYRTKTGDLGISQL
ncbi:C2H2 type zinc finger domain protein [Fusarium sp. NRRL 25303]|nr:C2H2 type zinc finger domain protein [Fusarium sp. NRRL 25303]